jgi:ribosomal protein S12 methylthiotransferase
MPKVALHNLGCNKNQVDGERILHLFKNAGYAITDDFQAAEVIVVNTCAFIREAQEEAIEAILHLASFKRTGRCKKVIVSGCFSERFRSEVSNSFPEVDAWVGVHDWETVLGEEFHPVRPIGFARELSPPLHTQHLKIAEGCSHRCTYCAIPNIRGPYKSRRIADIVAEARWLEERDVRELILVAQDSSWYGRESGGSLADLIETLLAASSFPWIRLMYLHPANITDGLLRLFATEKRLCPYFDIPLQHIADPILKAMNRRPLSGAIKELLCHIRETVPGAGLRTTFILGFPGETESHFRQLVRFMEEIQFDKLGVFPFSPEQGTPAFNMKKRPRNSTAQQRCEEIMTLQREISRDKLAATIGALKTVIADGPSDDPAFLSTGRSRIDAPEVDGKVYIKERIPAGSIIEIEITDASDYDLFGEKKKYLTPRLHRSQAGFVTCNWNA